DTEPQSVAGRWRALCRTHVKSLIERGEAQTQRLFQTLSVVIADVLILCGAIGTWDGVLEAVVRDFEAELYEVVNLALRFQWTAGECVISRDFVVYVADSDAIYDPTRMDSDNAELLKAPSARAPSRTVLCTTHLGLLSETKVGGRERDNGGKVRTTVLTKAKVVLKSDNEVRYN
ncbi:hypothetical protein BD309DRAFT_867110, partial [Dichomitus squalens]